jgi:hypothetical protein
VRTRTAAKRALSLSFVPVRQLMFCTRHQRALSSAAIDRMFGRAGRDYGRLLPDFVGMYTLATCSISFG